MNNIIAARHVLTGLVTNVNEDLLDHPVLGQYLVRVSDEPVCSDCHLHLDDPGADDIETESTEEDE